MILEIHAIVLPIISTYMDWLLEEYITCIAPDHCSRTWDLWPFRYAVCFCHRTLVDEFVTDSFCATGGTCPYWQELGRERSFVSESVFASIFISFVLVGELWLQNLPI